jgi:endo-1,4-beta-D-glucanase Y
MKSKLLTYLLAGVAFAVSCAQSATVPGTGDMTGSGAGGDPTGAAGSTGAGGSSTTGAAGSTGAAGRVGTGTGGTTTTGAGGTTTTGAGGSPPPPVCMTQTPSPAAGGANFPFPQHRLTANCGYPATCADSDVQAAWTRWKALSVVSAGAGQLRVQRPENSNDTVSEGIGYGMISAVYMNDRTTFDQLWAFAQAHFDGSGLMNWNLNSGGGVIGSNSATDGDEDIAFGLMMADKQWGGYTTVAKAFIGKIEARDLETDNSLKSGDAYNEDTRNPSYFAPAYYRAFAEYTGVSHWTAVLDRSYVVLNNCADASSGLVPNWCSSGGGVIVRGGEPTGYGYDAARTPFRIALDACWNNESRAKTYLAKVATFMNGKGVGGIVNGFPVKGTGATGTSNSEMVFIGPAVASAMPQAKATAALQALVDNGYARVRQLSTTTSLPYTYYSGSWGLWTMMLMTGNFVNFLHP